MTFFSYARVETGRLFRRKTTWIVCLLTVLCPFTGYSLYRPAVLTTRSSSLIANPALAGAMGAAFLFAFFTLAELKRVHKNRVDVLTDAIVPPAVMSLARTLAAVLTAILSCGLAALTHMAVPLLKMGNIFRPGLHFSVYFTVMLPAALLAVLAASAFYQITYRFDLSMVMFIAFALFSMSRIVLDDFMLRWINPVLPVLSDDFGNRRMILTICYSRLFWLAIAAGVWLLSSLCVRRYGRGLFSSFVHNIRKVYILLPAILLLSGSYWMFREQPFFDNSPLEVVFPDYVEAEEEVRLVKSHVEVRPDAAGGTLEETAVFELQNISGKEKEIELTTNPGYSIREAKANGEPAAWSDRGREDLNEKKYALSLPAKKDIELSVTLAGYPQEWSILRGMGGSSIEISKDYICLVNDEFSPSLSAGNAGQGQPPITADVVLPGQLTPVVSRGNTALLKDNKDGTRTWRITSEGSYIQFFAGDFTSRRIEAVGAQIDFYYGAKHQRVMEEIGIDEVLSEVFEYCSEHYGPFPYLSGEEPFRLVELTAYQFGGWAGNGFSTMDENSFSEDGMKNPDKGASGSEVMAHEIVHQWWGLGRMFEESQESGWSAEGLTVYTTYRLMKEKYGDAYARKNYVDQWIRKVDGYKNNFYVRNPEYLKKLPENYRAEILNSQSGVMKYSLIPLKILKAEELVGGEEKMDEILSDVYSGEGDENPYLTYQKFLEACGLKEEDLAL